LVCAVQPRQIRPSVDALGCWLLEPTQTGKERVKETQTSKNQCSDTNASIDICEVHNLSFLRFLSFFYGFDDIEERSALDISTDAPVSLAKETLRPTKNPRHILHDNSLGRPCLCRMAHLDKSILRANSGIEKSYWPGRLAQLLDSDLPKRFPGPRTETSNDHEQMKQKVCPTSARVVKNVDMAYAYLYPPLLGTFHDCIVSPDNRLCT
jgi:hypothetical protein